MKNIKKSIVIGLIFTSFAVFSPYLLNKNYENTAEWSSFIQFLFLWPCCSLIIYCIDNIKSNLKQ